MEPGVERCDVLIALIGKDWRPDNRVRVENETALLRQALHVGHGSFHRGVEVLTRAIQKAFQLCWAHSRSV